MTPQQRIIILVATMALATIIAAVLLLTLRKSLDKWGKAISDNQERSLAKVMEEKPEKPTPPRASLDFELTPQDEATSLLMGILSNSGEAPLENITVSSSMGRMIFAVENFAYLDEVHELRENGTISLTPGSSTRLCLGSVKIIPRLDSEYLRRVKRSPNPTLTISLSTPEQELPEPMEIDEEFPSDELIAPAEKEGKKSKPTPKSKEKGKKTKMTPQERKAEREAKKLEQKRERERKKIAQEEKKAARRGARAKKPSRGENTIVNAPSVAPNPLSPTAQSPVLSATFSIPLHRGFFPQADAQMLEFYKRDAAFERADTKGEVFENTMTFDGTPTRNLYRSRSAK